MQIVPLPVEELEHQVTPFFRHESIENVPQSEIQRRPVMEVHEVVELRFAGDSKYSPVVPADSMYRLEGHNVITYAERFADQYRAFQEGKDQKAQGTPLEMLSTYGITPSQLSLCRVAKIYSIEALYHLEGDNIKTLGQSANALKAMARAFMEDRSVGSDTAREIAELRAKLAQFENPIPAVDPGPAEIEEAREVANIEFEAMSEADLKGFIKGKTGMSPRGPVNREWLLRAAHELNKEDGNSIAMPGFAP
jgi:hypothetical protein